MRKKYKKINEKKRKKKILGGKLLVVEDKFKLGGWLEVGEGEGMGDERWVRWVKRKPSGWGR